MSIKNKLFSLALAALLMMPFGALLAQDAQGEITISVTDENKQSFAGNWYLYQGTSDNGLIKRNGAKGETFKTDPGFYYLVAHPINPDYKFVKIYSANPQELKAGESLTFKVQYFKSEEALKAAEGTTPSKEEDVKTPQEKEAEEAEARKKQQEEEDRLRAEAAIKAREKAGENKAVDAKKAKEEAEKKAEEEAAKKKAAEEAKKKAEAEAAAKKVAEEKSVADQIREAAIRRSSLREVPQFTAAPEKTVAQATQNNENNQAEAASEEKTPQLAATGTPGLLALLIPSVIGGLAFRKRKSI